MELVRRLAAVTRDDPDISVRVSAAFNLSRMGALAEPALPILVQALIDEPPSRERRSILISFCAVGGIPALDGLLRLASEGDDDLRTMVIARLKIAMLSDELNLAPARVVRHVRGRLAGSVPALSAGARIVLRAADLSEEPLRQR